MANKIAMAIAIILAMLALGGLLWLFIWNVCLIPVAAAVGGTVASIGYWTAVKVTILSWVVGSVIGGRNARRK